VYGARGASSPRRQQSLPPGPAPCPDPGQLDIAATSTSLSSAKDQRFPGDQRGVTERPFRFRLERVHDIRRQKERGAQEELATALGRQAGEEANLGQVDATIEDARERFRSAASGRGELQPGTDLAATNAYLERLAGRRAVAVRDLNASRDEVGRRRSDLEAAARERQALDRLRDRRREEHEREIARAESAQLDELAIAGHRRRQAS
jgi:flagellar FliJ protein